MAARRGEELTAEAMKNYRWVKPKLVADVEFTDWTAADHLRHSHFVGLRDDKDAKQVRKENWISQDPPWSSQDVARVASGNDTKSCHIRVHSLILLSASLYSKVN